MTKRELLTIIMPACNEEANLPRAHAEVTDALAEVGCAYEVLVIDNASTDGTEAVAAQICARDRRWRYVRFSRDFHVEASLAAGLRYARGDAAVVLFSDLQDPPSVLPDFVRRWRQGYDVVYGVVRQRQGDPWWKAAAARLAYRLIRVLSDVPIPPDATDFRLLSRKAIDAVNRCGERYRYARGLSHWVGFRSSAVVYDRRPRAAGRSKAPLLTMLNLLANAITCFSLRPVQLFSLCGFFAVFLTLSCAVLLVTTTLPGLTTVHLLLLANLSATLLGIGTLGEYAARAYHEGKRRPLFVVDRTINLNAHVTRPVRRLFRTSKAEAGDAPV